jgi:hypothetical protein
MNYSTELKSYLDEEGDHALLRREIFEEGLLLLTNFYPYLYKSTYIG